MDEIPSGSRVALDTSVFIYFVEQEDRLGRVVRPVFDAISSGNISGVASVVTLVEVLVVPLRAGRTELVEDYRRRLTNTRGLTLYSADANLAETAAALRAEHNLRVADALVAATAMAEGCSHLLTNDSVFGRVPHFQTLIANDFVNT